MSVCGDGGPVTAGIFAASAAACVPGADDVCAGLAAGVEGWIAGAAGDGGLIDRVALVSGAAGGAGGVAAGVGAAAG